MKSDTAGNVLSKASQTDLSDNAKRLALSKELLTGNTVTLVCHMIEIENNLGRSLVIDLSADGANKFK